MQPFKTCPRCGQRCVPSMAQCGRCGAIFYAQASMPPMTFVTNQNTGEVIRRSKWLWAVLVGMACLPLVILLLMMVADFPRGSGLPIVGTWSCERSATLEAYTFRADGTGEIRFVSPTYGMDNRSLFRWFNSGRLITLENRDTNAPTTNRKLPWMLSDDRNVLTLVVDQYGSTADYKRVEPGEKF